MGRYSLLPDAREDLQTIRKYYVDAGSPRGARTVLRELRNAIRSLAAHPLRGHLRTDLTGPWFRFWPVRSYLIVYRAESRPVEILAVPHGHRDVARVPGERVDR